MKKKIHMLYPSDLRRTVGSPVHSPGFQPWDQVLTRKCVLKVRRVNSATKPSGVLTGHNPSHRIHPVLKSWAVTLRTFSSPFVLPTWMLSRNARIGDLEIATSF